MKKLLQLFSLTVILLSSANAFAYNSSFDKVYFRGTPNNWETTEMKLVADNTWETVQIFAEGNDQRFKFDIYGDWSLNYGEDNFDYIADQNGDDIYVLGGRAYTITFNDETLKYSCMTKSENVSIYPRVVGKQGFNSNELVGLDAKIYKGQDLVQTVQIESMYVYHGTTVPVIKFYQAEAGDYKIVIKDSDSDGYKYFAEYSFTIATEWGYVSGDFEVSKNLANFDQMYLRGSFNSWGKTEMVLVGNNVWQAAADFNGSTEFKFDVYGDWSYNFGASSEIGIALVGGSNIYVYNFGNYKINFNDETLEWWVSE